MRIRERALTEALAAVLEPGTMVVVHVEKGESYAFAKCGGCNEVHEERLGAEDPRMGMESGIRLRLLSSGDLIPPEETPHEPRPSGGLVFPEEVSRKLH